MNPSELISLVVFLVFIVVMTAMIGGFVVRAKTRGKSGDAASIGVGELEERIRRAVEAANEPLRREIKQLRSELDELETKPRKLPGGALHDPGLLAERGGEIV